MLIETIRVAGGKRYLQGGGTGNALGAVSFLWGGGYCFLEPWLSRSSSGRCRCGY